MDPLTAIGLASNIISFIDFATKIINNVQEIRESGGNTEENRSQRFIAWEMQMFSDKLTVPSTSSMNPDELALCRLANECQILSRQITDLLHKIETKDANSQLHNLHSALKDRRYAKEKTELQNRLANCRSQLGLQLTYVTSTNIKQTLEGLCIHAKDDSRMITQLSKQMEDSLRVISTLSSETQSQMKQLLEIQENTMDMVAQKRLLKALAFSDMHGRFDAVSPAHYGTFEWVFEESNVSGDHPFRTGISESLVSWLSSGDGIFHASGKLGSGKSTFMKFLYHHSQTKKLLKQWAGEKELITASFFFWKPGSELQKSFEGLVRSLLYESLKAAPELLRLAFPKSWEYLKASPWHAQTDIHLSSDEIRDAFKRLTESPELWEKHCLCFFIDGLDEYEGSAIDNTKLMERLCGWVNSTNIKICASSREYNVFMNWLSSGKRIRLQDLTAKDIENYVHDELNLLRNVYKTRHLTGLITSKADGIFLWVTLVVKRLREMVEDDATLDELTKEIDSYPQGLEELFLHILRSLDPSYRKRAYQTFSMILALKDEYEVLKFQIPVLPYFFLDKYENRGEHDYSASRKSVWLNLPEDELKTKSMKMLTRYCKGLVESGPKKVLGKDMLVLSFTHRSVPEFILSPSVQKEMKAQLKDSQPANSISYLILVYIWTLKELDERELVSFLVHAALYIRHTAQIITAPFHFEQQLDDATKRFEAMQAPITDKTWQDLDIVISQGSRCTVATQTNSEEASKHNFYLMTPIFIAAHLGISAYVEWKLDYDRFTLESAQRMIPLYYCAKAGGLIPQVYCKETSVTVGLLCKKGLNPNASTSILETGLGCECLSLFQSSMVALIVAEAEKGNSHSDRQLIDAVEQLLQNGANPNFWIRCQSGTPREDDSTILLFCGQEQHPPRIIQVRDEVLEFHQQLGEKFSLRQYIEHSSLPKKERLLELVDRNMKTVANGGKEQYHIHTSQRSIVTNAWVMGIIGLIGIIIAVVYAV